MINRRRGISTNRGQSCVSDLMNLSAASFEPLLSNQVAVVGEEQELQVSCLEPSGLPPPRVYWRDPKGHIISDSGPVRVQDNTLIVAKARIGEDDGNYTCVAENMAGETDISAQVVISSKNARCNSVGMKKDLFFRWKKYRIG